MKVSVRSVVMVGIVVGLVLLVISLLPTTLTGFSFVHETTEQGVGSVRYELTWTCRALGPDQLDVQPRRPAATILPDRCKDHDAAKQRTLLLLAGLTVALTAFAAALVAGPSPPRPAVAVPAPTAAPDPVDPAPGRR